MKLFDCHGAKLGAVLAPTVFQTPLGDVHFEAVVDGTKVTDKPPSETFRLPIGGWLACWHRPDYDLELLACRPVFQRPFAGTPGMSLTDCWASLWRLKAAANVGPCTFTALWEKGYTWQEGGPNSGERLYAKTWNDALTEVSIGTEDEEELEGRSHRAEGLPIDWEPYFLSSLSGSSWDWRTIEFWQHDIHRELGDRGLALPLPALKTGQQCQIHFAVAWSPYDEAGVTTWLAVDQTADTILTSAGCS